MRWGKGIREQTHELRVSEIKQSAPSGKALSDLYGISPCTKARLLSVHEADGSQYKRADVPGRGPGLLVEVCETGADRRVDFEATRWRVEVQLGCPEWVVLVQLQQSVVQSSRICPLQSVEAEVKVQRAHPSHQYLVDGVPFEISRFLFQSEQSQPLSHACLVLQTVRQVSGAAQQSKHQQKQQQMGYSWIWKGGIISHDEHQRRAVLIQRISARF